MDDVQDNITDATTNAAAAPTPAVYDLADHRAAESLTVSILDPTSGQDTGMWITIESMYSKAAREAVFQASQLRLERSADKNTPPAVVAASDTAIDDNLLEQLVGVTNGWGGFVISGVALDCTPDNVRQLYTDPGTAWIRSQIQVAYLSLARFFAPAKAN